MHNFVGLPGASVWAIGVLTATVGIFHKEFKLMGRDWFFGLPGMHQEDERQRWFGPLDYQRAQSRWSYYTKNDPGPTFAKFEDK